MTAGIFANHGVWVGPSRSADEFNAKGYFESTPFKSALIEKCGKLTGKGRLAPRIRNWKRIALEILRNNGYQGGPWMVKHSAMYYPLWHEFDPQYVCVRRNLKAIQRSGQKSGFLKNPEAIAPHVEAMDHARDEMGGVDVFTDEIVRGDYSSLEAAFDHCGLEFNPAIAEEFVDPKLWHH